MFVQTYWLRYQPCSFAIAGPHLPTQGYIEYTPPPPGGKFHNILFYCFFIVILFKKLHEVYFFALYQDLVHPLLTVYFQKRNLSFAWKEEAVALGGYSHTLPILVCAAQRGRDFEAPCLERGIHFRGVF